MTSMELAVKCLNAERGDDVEYRMKTVCENLGAGRIHETIVAKRPDGTEYQILMPHHKKEIVAIGNDADAMRKYVRKEFCGDKSDL